MKVKWLTENELNANRAIIQKTCHIMILSNQRLCKIIYTKFNKTRGRHGKSYIKPKYLLKAKYQIKHGQKFIVFLKRIVIILEYDNPQGGTQFFFLFSYMYKMKKNQSLHWFRFSKTMTNFEAFLWHILGVVQIPYFIRHLVLSPLVQT